MAIERNRRMNDPEVLNLMAQIDQMRATLRDGIREMPNSDLAVLIKQWATGRFDELDEGTRLLAGQLAVAMVFELLEDQDRPRR